MSNTGFKGITDMEPYGVFYYKVSVSWEGETVCKYISKNEHRALVTAVRLRGEIEQDIGKPRTEMHIRSSGVFHQRVGRSKRIKVVEWERE